MNTPFFWLGISILLVAISLMALLTVAILALQELARAARSAEKLLDNLNRELPATLHELRLTGKEISTLTDEVSGGVQSARNVARQVDQGLVEAKTQAQKVHITTRSVFAGASAAFRVLAGRPHRRRRRPTRRPPITASSAQVSPPTNRSVSHVRQDLNQSDISQEVSHNSPATSASKNARAASQSRQPLDSSHPVAAVKDAAAKDASAAQDTEKNV